MYQSPENLGSAEKINEATVNGYIGSINGFLENDHMSGDEIQAAIDVVKHYREISEEDFETQDLKNRLDTAIDAFDNWVFAHQ